MERRVECDASCKGGGLGFPEREKIAVKITDTFEFPRLVS